MDYSLIAAASQGLGVMKTLVEGMVSIRDETKLQLVRIELLEKIIQLTGTIHSLQQEQHRQFDLYTATKKELDEAKKLLAERDEKELFEVRPGAWVLTRRTEQGRSSEPPYYCQACDAKGTQSVLHQQPGTQYEAPYLVCKFDSAHKIKLGPDKPLPTRAITDHPF
jgi:hypothetical protein